MLDFGYNFELKLISLVKIMYIIIFLKMIKKYFWLGEKSQIGEKSGTDQGFSQKRFKMPIDKKLRVQKSNQEIFV